MKYKNSLFRPGGLFLLGLGAVLLAGCGNHKSAPVYEFTSVVRSTLEKTVSSTGTLNPVATVKVLPRMSGKVEKIYTDFNAPVKRGEILAELNTDVLRLKREQQMAQVIKARANYELQRLNYQNQEKLAEKNLIAEYEFKNTKTNLDILAAELAATEANLKSIEIEINQYAFITSPIDGIVLERNINEGDTVVDSSSTNSSFIFTLAENLEEMQIESWVGELDISSIREGQDVRFTLESLPGRTYRGTVESKRLMPSIQDNVVSYKVIISVSNRDGSLLPGMTCSVEFIEERNENILVVPNAALRYQPTTLSADEIEETVFNAVLRGLDETQRAEAIQQREEAKKAAAAGGGTNQNTQGGLAGLMMPSNRMMRIPGQGQSGQQGGARTQGQGHSGRNGLGPPRPLWFIDSGGKPDVILVHSGISDGSRTEIQARRGENDPEGMQIILRERIR
jgi:HlyD family secretion protein